MKMKYSRKCLVCNKEVISSNKRTFIHPECNNRSTSPVVETKTAEEILNKICGDWMPCKVDGKIVPAYLHDDVIKCMETYHAQLKPQLTNKVDYSKDTQASMSDEEIRIVNMLAEKEPSCYADIALIMIEYTQSKQADTMSRLEEENQVLRSALNQDKTGLAKGLADVRKLLDGYQWICEGRGPYAWNDERYKKEVLTMLNDIEKVAIKALRESGTLATTAIHFRVAKEALKEKQ